MQRLTRRELLKTSASVASATALTGLGFGTALAKEGSPNGAVRLAVIGCGGRGNEHIRLFSAAEGAKLVAFCDVDQQHVDEKADAYEKETGTKVDRYIDYRKLLERKDIDAITIATPNHWHALMTIHGLQAGRHVYCEKPVCHTVWEGRQMVLAAKHSDLITASGFQNRSDAGLIEAMGLIHSGEYGAIKQLRGLCYRKRKGIGKLEQQLAPPASVNYDLWLGPAADLPIMRGRFHYDWHWDFNTGNGDMGNQGPHEMDLLRWAMGEPMHHPTTVKSFGGRFAWDDAGNTPNMQCALFNYGNDIPVIFEVRNLYQKEKEKQHIGAFGKRKGPSIIVTCEKGEFRGGRGGGKFFDNDGKVVHQVHGGNDHYQNFVDAVRNSDPGECTFFAGERLLFVLHVALGEYFGACWQGGCRQ